MKPSEIEVDAKRTEYGGRVPWCDTEKYRGYVEFVHPEKTIDGTVQDISSLIVLHGKIMIVVDEVTTYVFQSGEYFSMAKGQTYRIAAVSESQILFVEGK